MMNYNFEYYYIYDKLSDVRMENYSVRLAAVYEPRQVQRRSLFPAVSQRRVKSLGNPDEYKPARLSLIRIRREPISFFGYVFESSTHLFVQPTAVTMKCDDQFPLNLIRSIETTCENRSYTVIISVPFTIRDGLNTFWGDSSDSNKIFIRALGIMSCTLALKAVADQSFLFTCF